MAAILDSKSLDELIQTSISQDKQITLDKHITLDKQRTIDKQISLDEFINSDEHDHTKQVVTPFSIDEQILLEKEILAILRMNEDFHTEFQYWLMINIRKMNPEFLVFLLFEAVKHNKVKELEYLLLQEVFVDSRDCHQNTPLIAACGDVKTSIEMITVLFNAGASLENENDHAYTPYLNAVKHNRQDIMAYLALLDPSLHLTGKCAPSGTTMFMAAADGGHLQIMKEELEKDKKAWKKKTSNKYNAFMFAARNSHPEEIMNFLLKFNKKFLRKYRNDGWTPLMSAAEDGSVSGIEFLLKHDKTMINKYCQGWTAFMSAARGGSVPAMKKLLEFDKNIYKINYSSTQETPFIVASRAGHVSALQFLLTLDKDFHTKTSNKGITPFMAAAGANKIEVMEFLLQLQLQLNQEYYSQNTEAGWSPLMVAAFNNRIAACRFILKINPSAIHHADKNGEIALHQAAFQGHIDVLMYLLSQGSKIKYLSNANKTEEDFAKERGFVKVSEYLQEVYSIVNFVAQGKIDKLAALANKGHTLNFRTVEGNSLLHIALDNNQLEVALYLLELGVQKEWVNDQGETAFDFAYKNRKLNFLVSLVKKGALPQIIELKLKKELFYYTTSEGNSLLHWALSHDHVETALYLVDKQGVSDDLVNDQGETAYDFAIKQGKLNTLVKLFTIIANRFIQDDNVEDSDKSIIIHELRQIQDKYIAKAESLEKSEIDYEFLAENYDNRYWAKWAKKTYDLRFSWKTDRSIYLSNMEKLSQLILSKQVICEENNHGAPRFKTSEVQTHETQKEKLLRLEWSLKCALQANKYDLAMLIILASFNNLSILVECEPINKTYDEMDLLFNIIKLQLRQKQHHIVLDLTSDKEYINNRAQFLQATQGNIIENVMKTAHYLVREENLKLWTQSKSAAQSHAAQEAQLTATRKLFEITAEKAFSKHNTDAQDDVFLRKICPIINNLIEKISALNLDLDYKFLAQTYHPKYWAKWAQIISSRTTDRDDYQDSITISKLIFYKIVHFEIDKKDVPLNSGKNNITLNFKTHESILMSDLDSQHDLKNSSEIQHSRGLDDEPPAKSGEASIDIEAKRLCYSIMFAMAVDDKYAAKIFFGIIKKFTKKELTRHSQYCYSFTDILMELLKINLDDINEKQQLLSSPENESGSEGDSDPEPERTSDSDQEAASASESDPEFTPISDPERAPESEPTLALEPILPQFKNLQQQKQNEPLEILKSLNDDEEALIKSCSTIIFSSAACT